MSNSGQNFVARHRAPRARIEYGVELYSAGKKASPPFVKGVPANLTGASDEALPSIAGRRLLAIPEDL